jgi:hypothetical protein
MCQIAVSMKCWIATLACWGPRRGDAPVAGAEVGTRVLGAGYRRGAGSDVAAVAATGVPPKERRAPLSCARPKGFEPLTF